MNEHTPKIYRAELYRIFLYCPEITIELNRTGMSNDWYKMSKEGDLKDAKYAIIGASMIYDIL